MVANYTQANQTYEWGSVHYLHGSAEEITSFTEIADRRFDLVFMGQTIEHIEVDALPGVLAFIREQPSNASHQSPTW